MKLPERIHTRRLVLRPASIADAHKIYEYAADPKISKYIIWKPHKNIESVRVYIKGALARRKAGTEYTYVIEHEVSGELMGSISARISGHKSDIGYVLARKYWGSGYATEATKALIKVLMKNKSLYRIWATCDVANKASARVLQKSGMKLEGTLKRWMIRNVSKKPRDTFCYSKTR